MYKKVILSIALGAMLISGCGVNSVTPQQLEQVKAGDGRVARFFEWGASLPATIKKGERLRD